MSDIGILAAFMKDFWQFVKKNYETDPDWKKLTAEAEALGRKHDIHGGSLPSALVNAYLDYLDRREKVTS